MWVRSVESCMHTDSPATLQKGNCGYGMWVQGCESQMMIGVFPLRRELALALLAFYITCYRTNA